MSRLHEAFARATAEHRALLIGKESKSPTPTWYFPSAA